MTAGGTYLLAALKGNFDVRSATTLNSRFESFEELILALPTTTSNDLTLSGSHKLKTNTPHCNLFIPLLSFRSHKWRYEREALSRGKVRLMQRGFERWHTWKKDRSKRTCHFDHSTTSIRVHQPAHLQKKNVPCAMQRPSPPPFRWRKALCVPTQIYCFPCGTKRRFECFPCGQSMQNATKTSFFSSSCPDCMQPCYPPTLLLSFARFNLNVYTGARTKISTQSISDTPYNFEITWFTTSSAS